jgi:ABC-type lipoprotein export system ATPase subunit
MDMIELKQVKKEYASPSGGPALIVLDGIDLSIDHGDSLAIMGPSGSGKSTLLNLIGTMDQPSSGEINFEGRNLNQLSDEELGTFRAQQVGFIFQDHRLLPQCTMLENVLLPTLTLQQKSSDEDLERARFLIDKVGLGERAGHFPAECSGGECQRIAVVRALINQPKLILADEPTGALDEQNARGLMQYLCELIQSENCSMVMVTHDAGMLEYTKRNVQIKSGKLI